jgi:hypothetical protein
MARRGVGIIVLEEQKIVLIDNRCLYTPALLISFYTLPFPIIFRPSPPTRRSLQ